MNHFALICFAFLLMGFFTEPVKVLPPHDFLEHGLCIDEVWYLDEELNEISGLSFLEKDVWSADRLLAVNDEKALIYFINPHTGKVEERRDFGKNADFEGIELVGDRVFITEHNGDLHSYKLSKDKAGKEWKTPLRAENDIEGLGYDRESNMLLLACKGEPHLKGQKKPKHSRSLYGFSLDDNELIETPILLVHDDELQEWFEEKTQDTPMFEHTRKKYLKRLRHFAPSGIAVHPKDGRFFFISSHGKLLVVYDKMGGLEHIEFLHESQYSQPEGICFSSKGELYISNEGRGLLAEIYRCTLTY